MENLITAEPMQSETIGKLALALSKAQGQMEGAEKGIENSFFKSKYADLHECICAAKTPLSNNELAVIQTTELSDIGLVVVTTLAHSSGEWVKGKILMKPKKDDDQGRGSSMTYARRYSFSAIVGIAQKDDDGNTASGNTNNKQKKETSQKNKTKKLTSGDWETQFDNAFVNPRSRTVQGVKDWRAKHGKDIIATISNDIEATKLKGFLADMEALYGEGNKSKLQVNI